ncbi:MAG: peroxidase family protein, partial [Thermoleophilia bacterium]
MRRRPVRRKRTRIGIGGLLTAAVLVGSTAGTQAGAVTVAKGDLDFILQQIKISENHAGGGALLGNGPNQVPDLRLPWGLRTVDGSMNNLIPGREKWGASDELFPRLLPSEFKDAEDLPFGPPGVATSYADDTVDDDPSTPAPDPNSLVSDSRPRQISNLVADQTVANEAAREARIRAGGDTVDHDSNPATPDLNVIPNIAPDGGLAAPFSSWMTLFGQFFDHGLDLVPKGGNGSVVVPLKDDDPLIVGADGIANTADDPANPPPVDQRFMVLTRATTQAQPGPDGLLGTADDIRESVNKTTPFIDQQQTYGSHGSIHFFLREYELVGTAPNQVPIPTGRMLGQNGGLATWADVKAQAANVLGIQLVDMDAVNAPMVMVDQYGRFLPGGNGMPQLVVQAPGGTTTVPANLAAPVATTNAVRSNHAFLDDIAHGAAPKPDNSHNVPLLAQHFVAGDGRANENIGLTAVHHTFHAEHNRMAEQIRRRVVQYAVSGNDLAFLNEWLRTDLGALPGDATQATVDSLAFDGERIFQAARFVAEMEYQHLVFEEFARTVEPNVQAFVAYSEDVDPTIVAEFAHVVYRFGHSMLTETVDVVNADGADRSQTLIAAFLNPIGFDENGTLTAEQAAGAIARGMSRQVGNEIDEFTTEALRNNLLGLPLDLPTLNLTRARETGVPSLNEARRHLFQQTQDPSLAPHQNWADFGLALRHPESLVNFVAAYGLHDTVTTAATSAAKREAATLLVLGGTGAPADRLDFLNSTGLWANQPTGLEDVDFWIGGLAEAPAPAAALTSMLSPTFAYVFRTTLEKLQSGDRFYYLARLEGLNLLPEIEANSFAEIVQRNTDMRTMPFNTFMTPDFVFDLENEGTAN